MKPQKIFYGWWMILASSVIVLIHTGIWWMGFGVLLKPIANEFNWSRAVTSGAFSIFSVEVMLLGPLTGWVIDRFGPRVVCLLGTSLMALGYIALSQVNSLTTFYVTYALFIALGAQGTSLPPHAAAAARWFIKKRARVIGYLSAAGAFGGVLITPLMFPLISAYGWRVTSAVLGSGFLLVGFPLAFLIRPGLPEAYGLKPDGEAQESHSLQTHGRTSPAVQDSTAEDAFRSRSFWLLVLAWWAMGIALVAMTVHLVPLLTDRGLAAHWVALAVQILSVMSVASRVILPWFADRYDIRYSYSASFVLVAIALLILMAPTNLFLIFLSVALLGLGHGSSFPLRSAIIGPYFGRRRFATIQGWMASLGSTGGIIGPILAGAIFDATGNYQLALLFMAAAAALAAAGIAMLPPPRSQE